MNTLVPLEHVPLSDAQFSARVSRALHHATTQNQDLAETLHKATSAYLKAPKANAEEEAALAPNLRNVVLATTLTTLETRKEALSASLELLSAPPTLEHVQSALVRRYNPSVSLIVQDKLPTPDWTVEGFAKAARAELPPEPLSVRQVIEDALIQSDEVH